MVPALIESIKVAGLVLVADSSQKPTASSQRNAAACPYRMPEGVDGNLKRNGILRFNESVDM